MRILIFKFLFFAALLTYAQGSSEIYHKMKKLNRFNSALYMAAHPDDENTRVIAWLSNEQLARTGYLSLTRGDGGQNLIGKEMGAELGILRTQELLAARSIDGGEQFFTRAVDFGYSKSPEESFEKWNKEKILHDAVWVIRKFQPDVIITRFPPDRRGGHGHHTASAILAVEAFEKARDPNAFPEQLNYVSTWEARSVYWNSSVWWNRGLDSIARNNPDYLVIDIGGYNSDLGVSYNELGTLARSQHKCQGFGVRIERGERFEYFQWLAGERLTDSFFEGQIRNWKSIGGNDELVSLVSSLERTYDFKHPEHSVEALFQIHKRLQNLPASVWRDAKLKECRELILLCSGLHIEALAEDHTYHAGNEVKLSLNLLLRQPLEMEWSLTGFNEDEYTDKRIPFNRILKSDQSLVIEDSLSNPYWINHPFENIFTLDDIRMTGKAENDPALTLVLSLRYKQMMLLDLEVPVIFKWSDRVKGEMKRPLSIMPETSVSFTDKTYMFSAGEEKVINIHVKNLKGASSDAVELCYPKGWTIDEPVKKVTFSNKYEEHTLQYKVTAPDSGASGFLSVLVNKESGFDVRTIDYDHIPAQVAAFPSLASIVSLDVDIEPGKVGYVEGAGDGVAQAISQLGYEVEILDKEALSTRDLGEFQAIITGIRAYNVHPWLFDLHDRFMSYAENGGNFIVQYNTRSSRFPKDKMGPYPFTISRDRVSEEDAKVKFVDPGHTLLSEPNPISPSDFDGWVQERGLYFASDWDTNYQLLYSWSDKDESPKLGALLYCPYGNGSFIYTGISFFRQLPAGVPGAYKLLANMISHEAE